MTFKVSQKLTHYRLTHKPAHIQKQLYNRRHLTSKTNQTGNKCHYNN